MPPELSLDAVLRWALLVLVSVLPFVLSALAVAADAGARHRRRGPWLPEAAGPWLERQIAQLALPVRVEVHPNDGLDAYWPGVGAIGLSNRTWGGCRPADWAIAAHELGHALNMSSHRLVAELLPTARLVSGHAWRGFVAALLCAALLGDERVLALAHAALWLAVGAGAVVVADEALASRHAVRLLAADRRMRRQARTVARQAMTGAFAVYALAWIGQLAVLVSWSAVARTALQGIDPVVPREPSAPAVWLMVFLIPVLGLRAIHVLHQVLAPEPVTSDFRLFTVMHREAQWEFLAGTGVLALVVLLHGTAVGPLFSLSLVLAATTAIGPVGGLLRALLLFPVLLLLRDRLGRDERDDEAFFPEVRPDEAAPALMALYSDPPWYLRASWLTHLGYLPMLVLLAIELSG